MLFAFLTAVDAHPINNKLYADGVVAIATATPHTSRYLYAIYIFMMVTRPYVCVYVHWLNFSACFIPQKIRWMNEWNRWGAFS